MKFKFTLNKTCKDSGDCSNLLFGKLTKLLGTKDTNQFHISISHEQNNHIIWLFLYDHDGKHEMETSNKDIITNVKNIKKFKGKKPTLEKLTQAFTA